MKKIKLLIFGLCIILVKLESQNATYKYDPASGNYIVFFGQDTIEKLTFYPSTKIVPLVRAWIVLVKDTFRYRYQITNSNLSEDHLSEFYLPNNSMITNIRKPNDGWYFGYHEVIDKLNWSNTKVNHYTPPGKDYYEIGVPPGTSVDGFVYSCTGLPSIVDCFFQSSRLSGADHELPGDVVDILKTLEGFPLNYVKGATVGPVLPPEPFIAITFLDTLLSYTHQSVTLGWLKPKRDGDREDDERSDDGIVKNIEKRIEKAKKELVKGDSIKARQELEKLVKKVETLYKRNEKEKYESDMVMTSEAYALLKYNTEYLINHLPSKQKKGEKEK